MQQYPFFNGAFAPVKFDNKFLFKQKNNVCVNIIHISNRQVEVNMGLWLMGKLGHAWVDAWGGTWVGAWWGYFNAVLYYRMLGGGGEEYW